MYILRTKKIVNILKLISRVDLCHMMSTWLPGYDGNAGNHAGDNFVRGRDKDPRAPGLDNAAWHRDLSRSSRSRTRRFFFSMLNIGHPTHATLGRESSNRIPRTLLCVFSAATI